MSSRRIVALTLALLATACSTNGTQTVPGLATGDDRLAADKSPASLIRIADATRAGGDPGSAVGLYQRAHEAAPKDPAPLARLGSTFTELHAYNEAVGAYRQAIDLAPNDTELRCGLATVLLAIDKPELALSQLEAALALRKEPRTYNLLGVANDLVGRHDVAQQNYAEGLRLAPDNLPLRNNLGLSQALAGAFEMAIATLGAAAESPKATARTRQNLALVYGLSGESDKAAAVARADLDAASVKSNLAYYAMLRGMDDRARAAAIIGAHAPVNGEQAAAPAPPAPVQKAEIAPVPVEPVETTPLATPAMPPAPATGRTKLVAQKAAPAKEATADATPLAVKAAERPAVEPAAQPAPLEVVAAPIEPTPTQAVAVAAAKVEAPPPVETAAQPEPQNTAVAPPPAEPAPTATVAAATVDAPPRPEQPVTPSEPQTAAAAPSPVEPAPVASAAAATTAPLGLEHPVAQPDQIAAGAPPPPSPVDAATPASATASNIAEPPAASDPAPQIVAALPEAALPEATISANETPTPADPFSRPLSGAASKRHGFLVQVGAFHDEAKAQKLCENLTAKGYDFSVSATHGGASHEWFFCRSSGVADHAEAIAMAQRLHVQENAAAFLVPVTAASKN